jgi:hypothetical protein
VLLDSLFGVFPDLWHMPLQSKLPLFFRGKNTLVQLAALQADLWIITPVNLICFKDSFHEPPTGATSLTINKAKKTKKLGYLILTLLDLFPID